jgi:hypothetical protein
MAWFGAGSHIRVVAENGTCEGFWLSFEPDEPMNAWTSEELATIGAAEEVQVASLRRDGTPRKPVIVWIVRHGDDLHVRSVAGPAGHWFRGTQEKHEGEVRAGRVHQDVTFVNADHDIDDEVDAAYRAKYGRYAGSILNSVLTADARSSTVKLVPGAALT